MRRDLLPSDPSTARGRGGVVTRIVLLVVATSVCLAACTGVAFAAFALFTSAVGP